MTTPRFTWLHLTDLHVGMSLARSEWPTTEYNALEDIKRCVRLVGTTIDTILFTGDLTQKAAQAEFDSFNSILIRIRRAIAEAGGGTPAFLAIPGNHDLDRLAAGENDAAVTMLRDFDRYPDLREKFWKDRDNAYRRTIAKAFERWESWSARSNDWGRFEDVVRDTAEFPGEFAATYVGNGYRIGLLGLNTAATQLAEGDYFGKLTLSGLQATALLNRPYEWSEQHDASLLLTHHPVEWLDSLSQDSYRNDVANPRWFDLHLCGHCHEQERTHVVRGGQSQLRIAIGRSLFGLEEFGELGSKKKRLFGFSLGQISFGQSRSLRFWPRANQSKQGQTWQIEEDHTEATIDDIDKGTPPEDLGASRRKGGLQNGAAAKPVPLGWQLVNKSFLESAAADIRTDDLSLYFDGDDPQWPAVASGRVAERQQVEELVSLLNDSRKRKVSTHLLVGPGGEGKTTIVMQTAARLGTSAGWQVLWKSGTSTAHNGRLNWEELRSLVSVDTALCLVIDDAHEVRPELNEFLDRHRIDAVLRGQGQASLHVLLCAHKDDWARSRTKREAWQAQTVSVKSLDKADALVLVQAYRREAALGALLEGETDDSLADDLLRYSASISPGEEAALLGALIEARTGHSLALHVERILLRTAEATVQTELPAMACYVSAATANASGLHRLPERALCEITGRQLREVQDSVALSQTELRVDGFGAYRTVRVRHGSIARKAVQIAFSSSPASPTFANKQATYRNLARALVRVVPEFWRSALAAPILNLSVTKRRSDPDVAVAVAEGAVEGAPDDIHLRSRLSQTYREVDPPDPSASAATCLDFFLKYPAKLQSPPIRALVSEWAVASGECLELADHAARNLWLALLSFSDQCGGGVLTARHLRHFPTVTFALVLAGESVPKQLRQQVAAAVLSVGRFVSGTPHLDAVEELADEAPFPESANELALVMDSIAKHSWSLIDDSFCGHPFLPQHGRLTFQNLKREVERF